MHKQTETARRLPKNLSRKEHQEKQTAQLQELWTVGTPAGKKTRIYSVIQFKQSMRSRLQDTVATLYYH